MSFEAETRAIAIDHVRYGIGEVCLPGAPDETKQQEGLNEAFVGNLLRYGVFFSIAVSALGSLLYFIDHGLGGHIGSLIRYSAQPAFPHSLAALATGIGRFSPSAVIAVGLLLLVALRVFQVLLSGAIFAVRRNFKFMWISLFVFGVLMSSLFLGKAGG